MTHPQESELALFAGGDVSWPARLRLARHVSGCAECGRRLQGYRSGRQSVRELGNELPEGLHWDRLAAEMKANIRVGLAAGECVATSRSKSLTVAMGWKSAAAFACAIMLLAGGWWLNIPPRIVDSGVSVTADRDGVEVKQNGAVMTLMNPGTLPPVVTASTQGEVRARYVDADTAQVTITNVYAQ